MKIRGAGIGRIRIRIKIQEITRTAIIPDCVKRGVVLAALLCLCFTGYVRSQCAMPYDGFQHGEMATYELSFNWKFVWTKAGTASLSFTETTYNSDPAYRMDLIAAGNKRADLFFKLRDTLTSIMTTRLEPTYFRKGAVEGKKYWIDEAFFSYLTV